MDSMRKFLTSYEQLRNCEKRMVADGFQEKYFTKSQKSYGRLIKILA